MIPNHTYVTGIARPLGLHYNHYVSPYVYDHILHNYAFQHPLTTGM